ncbi:MAG: response regulator transcription factor [Sciscionella sp.]|nr:response regulator transcription factor [Sciscionella sp.]
MTASTSEAFTSVVRVLVVDDEPDVRDSLRHSLEFEGYDVRTAVDGAQAIEALAVPDNDTDVVVMDLMMPGVDGLEACRRLRAAGDRTPVLLLTARDGLGDRVTGLDAGADDYLIKPFALEELLARLRALLKMNRRSETSAFESVEERSLVFADLELDPVTREVRRAGKPITLTRTEFELLEQLMTAPKRVLTRSYLLREIWGHEPRTNNLDVYISYLRRKTEADGRPRLIHTVHGVGYVLRQRP